MLGSKAAILDILLTTAGEGRIETKGENLTHVHRKGTGGREKRDSGYMAYL